MVMNLPPAKITVCSAYAWRAPLTAGVKNIFQRSQRARSARTHLENKIALLLFALGAVVVARPRPGHGTQPVPVKAKSQCYGDWMCSYFSDCCVGIATS